MVNNTNYSNVVSPSLMILNGLPSGKNSSFPGENHGLPERKKQKKTASGDHCSIAVS
jgi:hypothetical protein